MAFTDLEMAVLSELVYYDNITSPVMSVDLSNLLNECKTKLKRDLGSQYDDVINELIKKSKDYKIVLTANDKKSGFQAIAIAGPDNDVTVVSRGTECVEDVVNGDCGLIIGTGETNQHKQMEKFIDKLQKKGYDSYYFTGHSLGGNLAMYGAIYMAKTGKVKGVTVFNAPNFNDYFCLNHKDEIKIISKITNHYQNENDIVSSINGDNTFGSVVICKSADDNNNPLDFKDHYLGSFNIVDGSFEVSSQGKSDVATTTGNTASYGGTIILSSGLNIPGIISNIVTTAIIIYVINKAKEWLFKNSIGYKYATENPNIGINTTTMSIHAKRLRNLSSRTKSLDLRMNSLYVHAGVDWNTILALKNLGKLLKVGLKLDYTCRLNDCANYLEYTVNQFDKAENEISISC